MGMPEPDAIIQVIGDNKPNLRELAKELGVAPREYGALSTRLLDLKRQKRVEISATTDRYSLGHNARGAVPVTPAPTTPRQRRSAWNRDAAPIPREKLLAELHATRGRTTEAIALAVGTNSPTAGRLLAGMRRDGMAEKHGSHWLLVESGTGAPVQAPPAPKSRSSLVYGIPDPAHLTASMQVLVDSIGSGGSTRDEIATAMRKAPETEPQPEADTMSETNAESVPPQLDATDLPESMRAVLDAVAVDGSTVAEIATAVGSTVPAAGQRLSRLRARGLVARDGKASARHARWRRVVTDLLVADPDSPTLDTPSASETAAADLDEHTSEHPELSQIALPAACPPCGVRQVSTTPVVDEVPTSAQSTRPAVHLPAVEQCMRLGAEHLIALLRNAGVEIPANAVIDVDDAGADPLISVRWSA